MDNVIIDNKSYYVFTASNGNSITLYDTNFMTTTRYYFADISQKKIISLSSGTTYYSPIRPVFK